LFYLTLCLLNKSASENYTEFLHTESFKAFVKPFELCAWDSFVLLRFGEALEHRGTNILKSDKLGVKNSDYSGTILNFRGKGRLEGFIIERRCNLWGLRPQFFWF
jgi:hypothetical protein